MKNWLIKGVKLICFLLLLMLCIFEVSKVMQRKASLEKYGDFYLNEDSIDVMFFGTSHVINAYFPMELWEDYGITSYNFGGHANYLTTSYWQMVNAIDKKSQS